MIKDVDLTLKDIADSLAQRIDINIFKLDNEIRFWFYNKGFSYESVKILGYGEKKLDETDLDSFLKELENAGWKVFRWDVPGKSSGARAFFGTPWPIRSRWSIQEERRRFITNVLPNLPEGCQFNPSSIDFAFEM